MRSPTRPPRCRRAGLDGRPDQRAGVGLHGSAGRQGHRRRRGDMVLSLGRRIDGHHAEQRRRLDIGRKKPTLMHHQLHDGGWAGEQAELRWPKRRTACCQPAMRLCLGGLHPALTDATASVPPPPPPPPPTPSPVLSVAPCAPQPRPPRCRPRPPPPPPP